MAPTKRAQVRIRSMHPNLLISRRFSDLSDKADVLFLRLQMCCDDEGRCLADTELLKAWLFPLRSRVTPLDIEDGLTELAVAGLVYRYEHESRELLEVADWDEFQTPRRRYPSDYPPAPQNPRSESRDDETPPGGARVAASSPANAAIGVGEGEGGTAAKRRRAAALPRPFTVTDEMSTWAIALGADVDHETSKFVDHYLANGATRVDWPACWRKWIRGSVEAKR
jgi:hypothetical protein